MDFHVVKRRLIKLYPLDVFCAFAHANNHRLQQQRQQKEQNPAPLSFTMSCRITDSSATCMNRLLSLQQCVFLDPRFPVYSYVTAPILNLISVNMLTQSPFPSSFTYTFLTNVGAKLLIILSAKTHSGGFEKKHIQQTPISLREGEEIICKSVS